MSRPLLKLGRVESPDEGVVILPFKLQFVSGAPVLVEGDAFASVADTGTGKFTLTLRDKVAKCYGGDAWLSATGDSTDMYGQVDTDSVVSAGTAVVKTKTGSSNTDPPANSYIGGFLLCKKTPRRARR